jgi:hypothetical protein
VDRPRTSLRPLLAPLGRRLLERHAGHGRFAGLRLARFVAARHGPSLLESATRLSRGRSVARRPREEPLPFPVPPDMSEFAARWIFGSGPAEGVPFFGGGLPAGREIAPRTPAFLARAQEEQRVAAEAAEEAKAARLAAPVQRGQVEEVSSFRLSRTPLPRPRPEPVVAREPAAPPEDRPEPPPEAGEPIVAARPIEAAEPIAEQVEPELPPLDARAPSFEEVERPASPQEAPPSPARPVVTLARTEQPARPPVQLARAVARSGAPLAEPSPEEPKARLATASRNGLLRVLDAVRKALPATRPAPDVHERPTKEAAAPRPTEPVIIDEPPPRARGLLRSRGRSGQPPDAQAEPGPVEPGGTGQPSPAGLPAVARASLVGTVPQHDEESPTTGRRRVRRSLRRKQRPVQATPPPAARAGEQPIQRAVVESAPAPAASESPPVEPLAWSHVGSGLPAPAVDALPSPPHLEEPSVPAGSPLPDSSTPTSVSASPPPHLRVSRRPPPQAVRPHEPPQQLGPEPTPFHPAGAAPLPLPAPIGDPGTVPSSSRPRLALRRAVAARQPTRAPAGVERRPTSGLSLASATGAVIEREASGTSMVTFPQDEPAPAPEPPELFSSAVPEEPTLARAASLSPGPVPPLPSTPTAGAETARRPPSVDYDEIYAQVVERLRRELLREREQIGDLLGEVTL